MRCTRDGDSNVIGIVSTNPAFVGNVLTGADGLPVPGYVLVGLIGQVPTKVLVEEGMVIQPGDALTAASVPGYARKAKAGESTVGVALEPFDGNGDGRINVLISRRNQSLTVEAIDQKVMETIKTMAIEDDVKQMVTKTLETLNVNEQIGEEVERQMLALSLEDRLANIEQQLAKQSQPAVGTGSVAPVVTQPTGEFWPLDANLISFSGSLTVLGDIAGRSLSVTDTFVAGGDARIGGDLHLDGALIANDLYVPNAMTIDGAAVIGGDLEVKGQLILNETSMALAELLVENTLKVLGDITVEGMATFFKDVRIQGELILSSRQAGFAVIPATGTSVTVRFGTGFIGQPVVTASPDVPVLFGVSKATSTGFTIRIAAPATETITFSWHALSTDTPETVEGAASTSFTIFPVDSRGVPLSSNALWNACIRNQTPLDTDGKPYNCNRYHEENLWQHPDLQMSFTYDGSAEPAELILPEGYQAVVQGDAVQEEPAEEAVLSSSSASSDASSASSVSSEHAVEQSSASSEASEIVKSSEASSSEAMQHDSSSAASEEAAQQSSSVQEEGGQSSSEAAVEL